jgi:uncharacterized protein (DUF1499 family)
MEPLDVTHDPRSVDPHPFHVVAKVGAVLAALAIGMFLLSGPGTRAGLWDFRLGLTLFKYSVYLAIAAALVCLAGAALARPRSGRRGFAPALVGLVACLGLVGLAYSWLQKAKSVPPIHDITTDTGNPPAFSAVLPARRATALNPAGYEGEKVAVQQAKAYPDIKPLMMALTPDSAFAVSLAAAKEMGWEIVDANRDEGRIEATDVTAFFGFQDDVVIRVMPASGIARVDVRSVSRVGGSDVGTNAKRVRAYLAKLKRYEAVAG